MEAVGELQAQKGHRVKDEEGRRFEAPFAGVGRDPDEAGPDEEDEGERAVVQDAPDHHWDEGEQVALLLEELDAGDEVLAHEHEVDFELADAEAVLVEGEQAAGFGQGGVGGGGGGLFLGEGYVGGLGEVVVAVEEVL